MESYPIGDQYIASFFARIIESTKRYGNVLDAIEPITLTILGNNLSVLYRIATCQRGCKRDDHLIEALVGRAYNLSEGAMILIFSGLYDEAFSLIRSIGEITNLFSLFVSEGSTYVEWKGLDVKDRINKFGPGAVRSKLEELKKNAKIPFDVIMDKDWYSGLCETSTHPTPLTLPNSHNLEGNKYVTAGFFQIEGIRKASMQLAYLTSALAMISAAMFNFKDCMELLSQSHEA